MVFLDDVGKSCGELLRTGLFRRMEGEMNGCRMSRLYLSRSRAALRQWGGDFAGYEK